MCAADAPADAPRPLAKLAGPAGTAVEFSRDGKFILTAGGDEARVWDAATFEPVTEPLTHGRGNVVLSAAVAPDGRFVLTVSGKELWVSDVATSRRRFALHHGGDVRSASFGAGGSRIITASDDRTARVWDSGTGVELVSRQERSAVAYAALSPDGSKALTVTTRDAPTATRAAVTLWRCSDGGEVWRVPLPDGDFPDRRSPPLAAFSPDGKAVALLCFRDLQLRATADGELLAWADTVDDGHGHRYRVQPRRHVTPRLHKSRLPPLRMPRSTRGTRRRIASTDIEVDGRSRRTRP
jgi:WD40 repeat protein